jgi:hypothetical protein
MSDLGADELRRGLAPGARFRCDGCGNVTRFDVVATTRTRRYHHFDLGGVGRVEEEEILAETVESATCHWCGRSDGVRVEPAPGSAASSDRAADGTGSA